MIKYTFSESMARTITLRLRQPQNILGIESKAESHQSNSNSSNMKKQRLACVLGTLVSSPVAYPDERAPKRILQDPSTASASASAYKVDRMEKFERKEGNLASGIREHVITETVKGKLSLGAKIIRAGGVEKIFKQNFSNRDGEKLLKASQCYLSTTAGPIAGLLFISTDKVAFFSNRFIKLSSPIGEFTRLRYKVVTPLVKIKRANESQNMKRPSQKYIEIVTVDNFDFWFMGFLNYLSSVNLQFRSHQKAFYAIPIANTIFPLLQMDLSNSKRVSTMIDMMNKLGEKADHLVNAFKITIRVQYLGNSEGEVEIGRSWGDGEDLQAKF
ncbi:unnamed protein product [Camellia sinensis]